DRLAALLDRVATLLPQQAHDFWSENRPRLQRYVQEHRNDPLAWALVIAALVLLWLVVRWRRRVASRRQRPREEPHV
ncbi:MAG: hypothetical protein UMU75_04745, partial [Halomonas sp.]|nr:hypothetical protein [Halomonas sp.]